jgi:hypothetical protein
MIVNPGTTVVARNPITGREDGLRAVTATARTRRKAAAAVVIKQAALSQAAVINQAAAIKVDRVIMKAGNAIVVTVATVEARTKAMM